MSAAARILVARDPDGLEVLVWLWDTGEVQVATRPEPGAVWGPPLEVISDERQGAVMTALEESLAALADVVLEVVEPDPAVAALEAVKKALWIARDAAIAAYGKVPQAVTDAPAALATIEAELARREDVR